MADAGMILDTWGAVFPGSPMTDVTRILSAIEEGDAQAAEKLLPLVYEELRKLAAAKMTQEKPGQTLQATGLVHEAYVRLVDGDKAQHWDSRGHFFSAAAEAMRRILVDNARRKAEPRHGGDLRRVDLEDATIQVDGSSDDLLALDEALTLLAQEDPLCVKVVQMRYFAGCTMPEAAKALGLSLRTAERNWTYARIWLHREMSKAEPGQPS
jgi:RNA polymerase sigma factor (TIGR02999 family)